MQIQPNAGGALRPPSRGLLVRLRAGLLVVTIAAFVAIVGTTLIARANSTTLYGGSGCYATGETVPVISSVIRGSTADWGSPCNSFTEVYLESITPPGYADHLGSWGHDVIVFSTSTPSMDSTHNLCHTQCNGDVGTSHP